MKIKNSFHTYIYVQKREKTKVEVKEYRFLDKNVLKNKN